MSAIQVTYTPGSWALLARAEHYLLVEAEPTSPAVTRLWDLLESAADDAAGIIAAIRTDLPGSGFCLVLAMAGRLRLAHEKVDAELNTVPVEAGATLEEVPLNIGGSLVASTGTPTSALRVPLEAGIVAAGVLVLAWDSAAEAVEAPVEPDVLPLSIPSTGMTQTWAEAPAPVAAPVEPVPVSTDAGGLIDGLPWATGPAPAAEATPPALLDPPPAFLDPSPLVPTPPLAPPVFEPDPMPEPVAEPEPEPEAEPEPVPDPEPEPEPAPAPSAPVEAFVSEEQNFTIRRSQLAGSVTDTVLAGYCPQGHLSGAYGPVCRVCGQPMPEQTPMTVPRPSLGVLLLQTGDTVDLDRGAVLGRAPRVPEDATERPNLVNLAAYGRDVSRQHAEVVIMGWNVYVRDLGSANGTRIRDLGGNVTDLPPGELVWLEAGGTIDIADVTTLQFRAG